MKKITILLLAAGLQACSTISKETYTETRTLTYPKGGNPHLKEMYLRDGKHQEQNTYIGTTETQPTPEPNINDVDLIAPVPEVNNYQASYQEEKTLREILEENRIIQAKLDNEWLRKQL